MLKLPRPPDDTLHSLRRALVSRGLGLVSTMLTVAGAATRRQAPPQAGRSPLTSFLPAPLTSLLPGPLVTPGALLPEPVRPDVSADDYAGRALAVVLVDLHGFAHVNDLHGHTAGDLLLDRVATRLTGALDREGRAVRWGGDEFLVLLPDAGAAEVARVVNRLRFATRQPADLGGGRTVRITISTGTALRSASDDTTLGELVAGAGAALQREKRVRNEA